MLDPNDSSLLTNALTPPPGMVFDRGLVTTYSLDLLALLTVPLHLTWLAGGADAALLSDGVRLLEGMRRVGERLAVFADYGRLQAPSQALPLYALLESCLVEVRAPNGGAFHPKLWLLRFTPAEVDGVALLRLLVLSRNLTYDRSWDLALQLEGQPGKHLIKENKALGQLLADLPTFAVRPADTERTAIARQLAEEFSHTQFEPPKDWEEVKFHVLGRSRKAWLPPASNELAVISPFLSAEALKALAETTDTPLVLVSRPDQLAALDGKTRALFQRCWVLEERAETEDGEEIDASWLSGLHAKALLLRSAKNTHLFVGSANATDAALRWGSNIEVMAELSGRHSKVGRVEELLSVDDFGELLAEFNPDTPQASTDPAQAAAEKALEEAHKILLDAKLRLQCETDGKDTWRLLLHAGQAVKLLAVEILGWPLSLREERANNLAALATGGPVVLAAGLACADLTGFAGFKLSCAGLTHRFALNLPIAGLPAEREAAILRRVVNNRDGFLRYLRLLLADIAGQDAALGFGGGAAAVWGAGIGGGSDALLEDLVRAFTRDREKLKSVHQVVEKLRDSDEEVVPAEFLAVWDVFQTALEEAP